jgi:hypothetical protein
MWEDGAATVVKGPRCEGLDRVQLAQYMIQWWAYENKVGYKPLDYIKRAEFLDQMSDYQFLAKASASCTYVCIYFGVKRLC